jgi:hypothetical protein
MANQSINVYTDRFKSLAAPPSAWLLVLQAQPYLNIGDTLTVNEIDSIGNPTGRYLTAVCAKIRAGEFYSLPKADQLYYFTQKSTLIMPYIPTLFKVNTAIVFTGTVNNTIVFSVKIKAGTFSANDFFRYFFQMLGSNNANNKTVRFYFNNTAVLTGATQIGAINLGNSGGASGTVPFVRNMSFKNSLSVQYNYSNAIGNSSDEAIATSGASSPTSINFAVDQYFIIAVQLASAGDTVNVLQGYAYIVR